MNAVTYPSPEVQRTLSENFVPVQLRSSKDSAEEDRFGSFWTPACFTLDERGRIARRNYGYIPPDEMVAELHLAHGQYCLMTQDYASAFDHFTQVQRDWPNSRSIEEALYWMGVSAYKRDGKPDGLIKHWHELRDKNQSSPWWVRASFIDRPS